VSIKNGKSKETGNRPRHTTRRTTIQKHNTICTGHHYGQVNTHNICVLLQRSGGNDVPNTVLCTGRDYTEIRTWRLIIWPTKHPKKGWATRIPPKYQEWTKVLAKDKQSLLLTRQPPWYSYIQSSPVRVLAVIEERKYLLKKKILCHLRYGYVVTVNQIVMTTI